VIYDSLRFHLDELFENTIQYDGDLLFEVLFEMVYTLREEIFAGI